METEEKYSCAETNVVDIDKNRMVQTREIHCPDCGRFMGWQAILWGTMKIKCSGCKQWIILDINPENKEKIRRFDKTGNLV